MVPVRNPDFWNSSEVNGALTSTLGFLSDDNYEFSVACNATWAFGIAVAVKLSSGSVAARMTSPGSLIGYPSRPDTMRV